MRLGRLNEWHKLIPQNVHFSSKWEPKSFSGLPDVSYTGMYIWSHEGDTYFCRNSQYSSSYYLKKEGDKFSVFYWFESGSTAYSLDGSRVWTDGINTYYSDYSRYQLVLKNGRWVDKVWEGFTPQNSNKIWGDGVNTYYSSGEDEQYILKNGVFEPHACDGYQNIHGSSVWSDGKNIYHNNGSESHQLVNNAWVEKSWPDLPFNYVSSPNIWTDGKYVYRSSGNEHHVLVDGLWIPKTWEGLGDTKFYVSDVWSDGTNMYIGNKYVLVPSDVTPINPSALMQGFTTMLSLRRNRT